ncbi:unnamed protein product [Tetraodon nigroviridis]|uniref:Chromosome undetermined SCAF13604, whole genome shotgun sequence n=1 Tax=Tetraodon nigroviridis TaxID=99883 RepID=Q4SWN4_TETNG|nr:unnamed protein product [Tetraodon nigroviridis]
MSSKRIFLQPKDEVDEVEDKTPSNGKKPLESDQDLSEQDEQSEASQAIAFNFESRAGEQRRRDWWRNMGVPEKIWGTLIYVIVIIFIIIMIVSTSMRIWGIP